MKIFKSFLYGLVAMATLGGFTSCQDDIDAPEPVVPVATMKANTTIFDLKKEFWDDATNYIKKIGTKADGSHYIVAGRVITSDEGGNIFKSITIQDETAALTFSVNTYNLFLNYRIGQELVVDLTDLYIGKFNGLQQIGWPEFYEAGNVWEATFMAPQLFYSHVEPNGLPEADKVIVHELSSISDIPSGVDGLIAWQGQVVRCNNIKFIAKTHPDIGEPVKTFGVYKVNMNQGVELDGTEVTMRVSGYADFVNQPMPTEACDAKFFLSYYGSGWQLMLMGINDIYNIGEPTLPVGTEENPYNVDSAIAAIDGGETPQGWVAGYIVGTVTSEVSNITSNADIDWGTEALVASTVVIASDSECRDYTKCFIVPLPTGSVMREYVAVRNHPENVGKELKVLGTLDHHLGAYGLVGNNGTAAEFRLEGVEVPGGQPSEGDGTQANPYNCTQVIAMNPQSTTEAVESGIWVKGYIVGYYQDYAGHFTASGCTQGANILLSSNPAAADVSECVSIQLIKDTDPRKSLNLIDNPGMLGAEVAIYGDVMKYNTLPGIKNTSNFEVISGGSGPVTPDVPTEGDGTEANPFSVGSIISMNPSSTTEAVASDVWVEGYLVGYYQDYNPHFSAEGCTQGANILMAATPTASTKEACICIQLIKDTDPRKALNLIDNPGNLGKKISVRGDVMKYNTLPGIKNTDAYKIDGQSGGDTPVEPSGDVVFEESFASSQGQFTIENIKMSDPLTYVWTSTEKYGMKASAYVNNANWESDAWLISPAITLPAGKSMLTFDHVVNKFLNGADPKDFCSVAIRENGGAWKILNVPTWSTNADWSFVNSGAIDLSAYAGKSIQIGFHYTSTTTTSGTWEIKNFKITK